MKNVIHRLVVALAAIAAGFYAGKEKLAATEKQLTDERQINTDLRAFIASEAPTNAALQQAKEEAEKNLTALQTKYDEETAEANGAIEGAEKAAADVHADEEIPITVEDGVVTHDTEAELPKLASEAPPATES